MQLGLWVIGVVLFCALLGAAGQIFLKTGSDQLEFNFKALFSNWKLILGFSMYLLASLIYIVVLKHGNLSLIYPIIATSYIWVALFSVYFLHEHFPAYRWIGIALIVAGIIIVVK